MFCKKCGNQISDGALFCAKCGASCGADGGGPGLIKQTEPVVPNNGSSEPNADDDCHEFGFKTDLVLALLAYGVAAGMLALILTFSEGYWSMLIFGAILVSALSWAGEKIVNVLIVTCVPTTTSLTATCLKVLRFFATLIVSIPFMFPAYGMVMGLIEVHFTECSYENGSATIQLQSYVKNCPKMNAFSRLGYKWMYRINVADKESLDAMDTLLSHL